MNDTDIEMRISTAHFIASTADSMIMDLFHKSVTSNQKALADGLITELDEAIVAMCLNNIRSAYAADGFMSQKQTIDAPGKFEWIVDPIAGTNNFIRGLPLCGFQLAILFENDLVYSVILRPFTQEWFTAQKGKGALYRNRQTSEEAPLKVSDRSLENAMAIFDSSVGKSDNSSTQILASLSDQISAVRAFGTAVFDIPAVVSGVAEAFITGIANKFYVAAGILLLKEAGGDVYDLKGNMPNLDDTFMIFSSTLIKEPLLKAIKSAL